MKLLIVESPTKVKKIQQFVAADTRVAASKGHVRDLPLSGGLGVEFPPDGRVVPNYQVIERSAQAVDGLRRLADRADEVLLATDPDREGEAIAWHIAQALGDRLPYRRVVFNAVTREAVHRALAHPRDLDLSLVGAQQARRVLDRVVGWLVSPVLRQGLRDPRARSAGRVQSVALRLVAEREREIGKHTAIDYYVLEVLLAKPGSPPPFTARLVEWKGEPLAQRLSDLTVAEATVEWCRRQPWVVEDRQTREQTRRPPPPFITSTAQQAASVQLGLAPEATMRLLQRLFEEGHITYHRTDSVTVAPEAVVMARTWIAAHLPREYLPSEPVTHSGKVANAQEAHEAIRPTHADTGPEALGKDETGRLYRLIWERFIASQLACARDFLTTIRVAVAPLTFRHPRLGPIAMGIFEARGKRVLFDGWRRLTADTTEEKRRKGKGDEEDEEATAAELPVVAAGDALDLQKLEAQKRTTKAPSRYTQASLIKKLEACGVGRPSTYATILRTLLEREYVEEQRRKLHCTELGLGVIDWLVRHFAGNFIEVDFTARIEADLDAIARGEREWQQEVRRFCGDVRDLAQRSGAIGEPLAPATQTPATGPAPACPLCGTAMVGRAGMYGPYWRCAAEGCPGLCGADGNPNRRTREIMRERGIRPAGQARATPEGPCCPLCGAGLIPGLTADRRPILSCRRFPDCGGFLENPTLAADRPSDGEPGSERQQP